LPIASETDGIIILDAQQRRSARGESQAFEGVHGDCGSGLEMRDRVDAFEVCFEQRRNGSAEKMACIISEVRSKER
jgi:hypothetical protein